MYNCETGWSRNALEYLEIAGSTVFSYSSIFRNNDLFAACLLCSLFTISFPSFPFLLIYSFPRSVKKDKSTLHFGFSYVEPVDTFKQSSKHLIRPSDLEQHFKMKNSAEFPEPPFAEEVFLKRFAPLKLWKSKCRELTLYATLVESYIPIKAKKSCIRRLPFNQFYDVRIIHLNCSKM